jgi:FkbM family methyltransferase
MKGILDRIAELSKAHAKEDFLHGLFGDYTNEVKAGTISVALFGAGAVGKDLCQVLQLHGVQPVCFCDNSPSQIGRRYSGVPVISFTRLKLTGQDYLIVVSAFTHADEIRGQLLENGFSARRIVPLSSISSLELLKYYHHCNFYTQDANHSWPIQDLQRHHGDLASAYSLLADRRSRDIFAGRLSLFSSRFDYSRFERYILDYSEWNEKERDSFPFYVSPEDYGYFNNDVVSLEEGETLVDGGAYNGLSAATFAKTCEKKNVTYRKVYCFEPDAGNFDLMRSNTACLPNVACIDRGLWSHSATLTFLSVQECDPGAFLEACGNLALETHSKRVEVRTTTIDEQFPDEEITFIKLDVEGAETEAIEGAANTIRRCRPKLAISAYHKQSDIYQLPLLINRLWPGYKLYLRQYGYTLFDMVLFAIP